MARKIFVCREENHNKYWIISKDPANPAIVLVWNGRLGSPKGAIQPPRNEGGAYAADRFISSKIAEKTRKGYTPIDEAAFKRLTIQSSVIGLSNKCESLTWVEMVDGRYIEVHEDRLMHPDYEPALLVIMQLKKPINGKTRLNLLFTADQSFEMISSIPIKLRDDFQCWASANMIEIVEGSPLYSISSKVEAGIAAVYN